MTAIPGAFLKSAAGSSCRQTITHYIEFLRAFFLVLREVPHAVFCYE
ncbi:MAG: hypothetical protein M0P70_16085 [Desulfobulbaceae bacterium]|nr:hypothetical protein [Desulfobulbaceae bacterium]